MSKKYFKEIVLFCFLAISICFNPVKASAQTLAAGDILFTGYDSTVASGTPDKFSIVAMTAIPAGTVIYFTERGYFNTTGWQGSGGTEGTIRWTVGTSLNIGDEILIAGFSATVNNVANGSVEIVSGGNTASGLSLSTAGDQVIAFQGPTGDPTAAANVNIAGIHWAYCPNGNTGTYTTDEAWDPINSVGACSAGPNSSSLPPGLSPTVSSLWIGFTLTPVIQAYEQASFNGAGAPFADAAALRAALLDKNNWTKSVSGVSGTVPVPSGQIVMQGLGLGQQQIVSFSLYPNPADSEVSIRIPNMSGTSSLSIVDMQGRVVKRQTLTSEVNKVKISNLRAAVYFFEVTTPDGRKAVKRMVKK